MGILKGIGGIFAVVVGIMVSIPQEEAVSNLSTWWVSFGLPSFEAIRTPAIDMWVFAVCAAIVIAVLVSWVRSFHRPSPTPNLREDVIDRDLGVVWTKDPDGHPIKATRIDDMKDGALAPSPAPPPPYNETSGQPGPVPKDPQNEDREAVAINPGNGRRVAQLILKARTVEDAERLFHDFMSQPHRYQEKHVFATYWVWRCKLQGFTTEKCWEETASAAVKHERETGKVDFWGTATINEVGAIVQEVYADETP